MERRGWDSWEMVVSHAGPLAPWLLSFAQRSGGAAASDYNAVRPVSHAYAREKEKH